MKNKIYEGSSKILYQAEDEYTLLMSFTDNLRLAGGSAIEISGKGVINNVISSFLMNRLDLIGIENHFIEKINMREQVVQFVDMCPIQVCVSTIARGRYVKDFGMEEGFVMDSPVMDFLIRSHELKYPPINENQMLAFNWVGEKELKEIKEKSLRIHDYLSGIFAGIGIRLVECKLEFGMVFNGEEFFVMLADEITPDTCRLWDMDTNRKFGIEAVEAKQDENPIVSYKTILDRLGIKVGE